MSVCDIARVRAGDFHATLNAPHAGIRKTTAEFLSRRMHMTY